jgi:hypothetical protein
MSLVLVSSIAVCISCRITTYQSQWLIQFYQSASKHGQRSSEKELYFHCTRMTLLLIFYNLGTHSRMLSLDDTIYFYSFHYFYDTFS